MSTLPPPSQVRRQGAPPEAAPRRVSAAGRPGPAPRAARGSLAVTSSCPSLPGHSGPSALCRVEGGAVWTQSRRSQARAPWPVGTPTVSNKGTGSPTATRGRVCDGVRGGDEPAEAQALSEVWASPAESSQAPGSCKCGVTGVEAAQFCSPHVPSSPRCRPLSPGAVPPGRQASHPNHGSKAVLLGGHAPHSAPRRALPAILAAQRQCNSLYTQTHTLLTTE